jgi:hypothetical protein
MTQSFFSLLQVYLLTRPAGSSQLQSAASDIRCSAGAAVGGSGGAKSAADGRAGGAAGRTRMRLSDAAGARHKGWHCPGRDSRAVCFSVVQENGRALQSSPAAPIKVLSIAAAVGGGHGGVEAAGGHGEYGVAPSLSNQDMVDAADGERKHMQRCEMVSGCEMGRRAFGWSLLTGESRLTSSQDLGDALWCSFKSSVDTHCCW